MHLALICLFARGTIGNCVDFADACVYVVQVDMVLLAGDLFHENKPSRTSLFQTIAALRQHTLGDRPVALELISDAGIGIARSAT